MASSSVRLCAFALAVIVVAGQAARAPAGAEPPLARHMSIFGLMLEAATFGDAHRVLGSAEVRHNGGDAAGSAHFACYRGPDGAMLILVSSGEMGGGTELTSYQLVARESLADFSQDGYAMPLHLRPRCSRLPRLSRAAQTDGGLRLGMTREEALRLLGRPSEGDSDRLAFRLETQVPMTPAEIKRFYGPRDTGIDRSQAYWDRFQSVAIRLEGDRVVAVQAWQVTTA